MKIQARTLFLRVIPWLHVTLIIVPIYCALASSIYGAYQAQSSFYFPLAFLFLLPIALCSLGTDYFKSLWQYALLSIFLLFLAFLLTKCWITLSILAIIFVVKLTGRVRNIPTVFDTPHPAGILVFIVPFIYSGIVTDQFLQIMTVILSVIYLVLALSYRGLERLQSYLTLNGHMANFPGKRISKKVGIFFAALAFAVLTVVLPTIILRYQFIPIHFKSLRSSAEPPNFVNESLANTVNEKPEWMAAIGENKKPPIDLSFLNDILIVLGIIAFISLIIYGIYRLSTYFSHTVTEKNDIIQSTADTSTNLKNSRIENKLRSFDFSANASIRRKYMKTIKRSRKGSPKPWHSPKEIESIAGIENQLLHEMYEKARYSPEGCTKDDVNKL